MDHMVGILVANLLDRDNLDLCEILVPTPMILGNDANNRDRYPLNAWYTPATCLS